MSLTVIGNGAAPAAAVPGQSQQLADPFDVLLRANNVVLTSLRRDEATPELQKQLTQTGMPSSAQAYFCDPYSNCYLGPQIRPTSFAMLPAPLARERDHVECMTFMGLLPEIDHAWMTVDNVLFLWNYHNQDFTQYRELEQVIVTVALVPPKRGVFQESVKHVLAVATTVEVVLLAVTFQGESKTTSCRNRRIQVRPTNFRAATDGVSMLKIAGHPNGRVFMAGKDGNMYELSYSVSYGFMYSVFFVGDATGARKCKRVRHRSSGASPSPMHAMYALLGMRSAQRTLADVVVDPLRNVLYTLDLEGNMDLFDLGVDGNQTTQKMTRFNIWEEAGKFCRWAQTSQGRLPDPSIFKDTKKFQVVSLGVVDPTESKDVSLVAVSDTGMRFYISCGYSGGSRHNFQLGIVWIRCPPPEALWRYLRESSQQLQQQKPQQHLALEAPGGATSFGNTLGVVPAAAGAAGMPLQRVIHPADGFAAKCERQSTATPSVYQAYSCHGVTILAQTVTVSGQAPQQGSTTTPNATNTTTAPTGAPTTSTSGGDQHRDRLILIGPDLVTRSKRRRDARQEEHPWMREAVTDELGGAGAAVAPGLSMGKVWAVSERPVSIMVDVAEPAGPRVRGMMVMSRTPSQVELNGNAGGRGGRRGGGGGGGIFGGFRQSSAGGSRGAPVARSSSSSGSTSTALAIRAHKAGGDTTSAGIVHRALQWRSSDSYPERPVAPSPPLVCSPGGSRGCPGGLVPKDVSRVVALPELATQLYSHRREIMCLTSAGLQSYAKLRPVDFLYELLAQNQPEKVNLFFDDFSPDQSAAMCFSIACGLPKDLSALSSDDAGGNIMAAAAAAPNHQVRARALDAALKNCKPPGFSSPLAAAGGGGSGGRGGGGPGGMDIGGVTIGEKFNNSALHNGLQLFIARLLRPFWFRPVVICGGDNGSGGGKSSSAGAKRSADGQAKSGIGGGVPAIMDLAALIGPLELLRVSIRSAFPRAVAEDLAAKAAKEAREAAAATAAREERQASASRMGGGGGHLELRHANGASLEQPETPYQRQQIAFKMEALEVHAAYRLVSRAAEAVHMVGALARVARDFPKAKVPWSLLSNIPLYKLVSGADEHKKAASLLADLVGPKVDLPPDSRDALARELGTSCPTFFSQGDVRTFEGVELLRRAATVGGAGAGATAAAEQGVALLIAAAKDWKGERALGGEGQLARACAALESVGRLDAVVDVCMSCARNFDPHGRGGAGRGGDGGSGGGNHGGGGGGGVTTLALVVPGYGGGVSAVDGSSWEEGVYQGGGVVGTAEREKATLECYQRVLNTVLGLMETPPPSPQNGEAQVNGGFDSNARSTYSRNMERAAGLLSRILAYDAPKLHEMLFQLLEEHDKSLLLRIKTAGVERYLMKDPELLFRHFMLHKEYPKAVYVMATEAHAEQGSNMHIRDRVDCLVKAISACHKCDLDSAQMVMPGWSLSHAKRQALEDEMDVMLTQERLLRNLEASMAPLQRLKEKGRLTEDLEGELDERARVANEWTWGIAGPTELYERAMAFFLWEGCLQLLQCCGKDEPALARKLVRSIIWREVPMYTREGEASHTHAFITRGRSRKGEVAVDDVRLVLDDGAAFEDDGWFGPLLEKTQALAHELLSRKETYVLPVDTLCRELQLIADEYYYAGHGEAEVPPPCVAASVRQAGVSPTALLDAYESMNRTCYPKDDELMLRWLEVMTEVLTWACQTQQPGVLAESVRPERVERLAHDTMRGLETVRASPRMQDPGAEYKIAELCRQLEDKVLSSVRTQSRYR